MRRLLEDGQLPVELRGDLLRSRAAGQDYPTAAKLLQLRAALSGRLVPASEPSSRVGLPARAIHTGWKLSALLVLAGGAAFLAQPTPRARNRDESSAILAQPELPLTAAAPEEPVPVPPELAKADTNAPAPKAAPSVAVPAASTTSSRREIAQLVRIRALVERDPAAAVRLAERSEREFPRGLLSEERRALSIVALTKTGAESVARQKARQYVARYPHSPMRELVEGALQD